MDQVEGCDFLSLNVCVRIQAFFKVPFFFVIHCTQLHVCTISVLVISFIWSMSEQNVLFSLKDIGSITVLLTQ